MENTKKCCDCKRILAVTQFNKNKSKKDGLTTECKDCRKKRDALLLQKRSEKNKKNPKEAVGSKTCSRCTETKSLSEFTRDNSRADGFGHRCKPCQKAYHAEWRKDNENYEEYQTKYYKENRERINERNIHYYYNNKDWLLPKMNNRRFFKKYGIAHDDAINLLYDQGNVCAICSTDTPTEKGWCVDHDHATGKVRGILCSKCNSGIGFLGDDPDTVKRALAYLINSNI